MNVTVEMIRNPNMRYTLIDPPANYKTHEHLWAEIGDSGTYRVVLGVDGRDGMRTSFPAKWFRIVN